MEVVLGVSDQVLPISNTLVTTNPHHLVNCVPNSMLSKSELTVMKNTQDLLLNYLMSIGQLNRDQLKQFGDGGGIQGLGFGGAKSAHFHSTNGQTLQGACFQLSLKQNTMQQQEDGAWPEHENVPDSNQVSRRLEGFQEGGFGGSQGLGEKEYVPETEFVLSTEKVNDQPFPQGVSSLCSLAIENDKGVHIVAIGEVYVGREGEVVKNHFKTVPSGHYRVCIKEDINSSAELSCPDREIKFVCQSSGRFLIWPAHLVFPLKKAADKQITKEFTAPSPRSPSPRSPSPCPPSSQSSCTRKYTITPTDRSKLTSNLVKVFKDVAIGMKKSGKTKSFTIPARVFLNEQCVSLDYEDMLDWCFQREIRSSHMLILMM
ncbi:uncharacterized protein [Spinacia oleracea]|uniref:Uncharacterized protein n=1 Tax=Spinacia oleracea TaxID=3562 RepID=A0ABM3QR19_SPIOL|nr:uncharacterized protein LOC130461669 [Spinacia oleracea]